MKLAAAYAIASVVSDAELSEDYIIPGVFNPRVVDTVCAGSDQSAQATGVARRAPKGIGGDDYAI